MNRPLLQQFADYAATRTGPFDTDDCEHCPMADFAHSLFPDATSCSAGEEAVVAYLGTGMSDPVKDINFNIDGFFTRYVEHCPSWEELTLRLRRALG